MKKIIIEYDEIIEDELMSDLRQYKIIGRLKTNAKI